MTAGLAVYAAIAATAFNLNCNGLAETQSVEAGKKVGQFSATFRIDLRAKKWCVDECKSTHDIVRFDDDVVVLQLDRSRASVPSHYDRSTYIRVSGHLSEYHWSLPNADRIYFYQREAQCTEAPFTGFSPFGTST